MHIRWANPPSGFIDSILDSRLAKFCVSVNALYKSSAPLSKSLYAYLAIDVISFFDKKKKK